MVKDWNFFLGSEIKQGCPLSPFYLTHIGSFSQSNCERKRNKVHPNWKSRIISVCRQNDFKNKKFWRPTKKTARANKLIQQSWRIKKSTNISWNFGNFENTLKMNNPNRKLMKQFLA